MSKHHIAVTHLSLSRNPATRNSAFQELVGARSMVKQSDRSDCPESGCVEHQKLFRRLSDYNVMRELVLSDDRLQLGSRLPSEGPKHHLFEGAKRFDFAQEIDGHIAAAEM